MCILDTTAQTVGVEEVPSFVYLKQMPFQLPVGFSQSKYKSPSPRKKRVKKKSVYMLKVINFFLVPNDQFFVILCGLAIVG